MPSAQQRQREFVTRARRAQRFRVTCRSCNVDAKLDGPQVIAFLDDHPEPGHDTWVQPAGR